MKVGAGHETSCLGDWHFSFHYCNADHGSATSLSCWEWRETLLGSCSSRGFTCIVMNPHINFGSLDSPAPPVRTARWLDPERGGGGGGGGNGNDPPTFGLCIYPEDISPPTHLRLISISRVQVCMLNTVKAAN